MEDRQKVDKADDSTARILPALHLLAALGFAAFLTCVLSWSLLRQTRAGPALWWCFDMYCHNMPSRSLWIAGEPLPVCARCTGVIAGYLLAGVAAVCGAEKLPVWRVPWALCFIGWMGLSWLGGYLHFLRPQWQAERVVAGALGGAGGYILIARCVVLGLRWWQQRRIQAPLPTPMQ